MPAARMTVRVSGGVDLSYLVAGAGRAVVCLPGWSQSAEQFLPVIEHLAGSSQVIAIDHRGHGRSAHPAGGYRISRLAADLHDVLISLDLHEVTLIGHSMGGAVGWAYHELYGADRLARLVLADQRPALLLDPDWTPAEEADAGATQTIDELVTLCRRLRSEAGWDALVESLRRMVSPDLSDDRFLALLETNRPTTNATRAALWFDLCTIDWRDLIPTISLPSLVVHGTGSMIPTSCQQWLARTIPNAELATIPASAGGSHFAFWENPAMFCDIVTEFLER